MRGGASFALQGALSCLFCSGAFRNAFAAPLTVLLATEDFFSSFGGSTVDLVSIEHKGKTFKSTEDCEEPNFTGRLGA